MPGPYAHITLLYELLRPGNRWLKSSLAPSAQFSDVLSVNFSYGALGAVSPDFPNLAGSDDRSAQWADLMHCTLPCEMILSAIRRVRGAKGKTRDKLVAWLLGYSSHVVADMTIHPVVHSKVGAYAKNQRQHRLCEMNQDSYIYRRMELGEIGESNLFAQTVMHCSCSEDKTQLDQDIVALWHGMFTDVHPEFSRVNPAEIVAWYREFVDLVSSREVGVPQLFPLAGLIAATVESAYPPFDAVDRQFVEEQAVSPEGPHSLHYDDIFDHALGNVMVMWGQIEQAICTVDATVPALHGEWNLDTGRDGCGRLVFWE